MQLCFEKSEEANYLHGLALVKGEVKKVNLICAFQLLAFVLLSSQRHPFFPNSTMQNFILITHFIAFQKQAKL